MGTKLYIKDGVHKGKDTKALQAVQGAHLFESFIEGLSPKSSGFVREPGTERASLVQEREP